MRYISNYRAFKLTFQWLSIKILLANFKKNCFAEIKLPKMQTSEYHSNTKHHSIIQLRNILRAEFLNGDLTLASTWQVLIFVYSRNCYMEDGVYSASKHYERFRFLLVKCGRCNGTALFSLTYAKSFQKCLWVGIAWFEK